MEPSHPTVTSARPETPSQRGRSAYVWGGLALILLGALGGWIWIRSLASSMPPPIATAVFPDGFAVQILRAELTDKMEFEVPPSGLLGKLRVLASPVLSLGSKNEKGFLPWTVATRIREGSFAGGSLRHEQFGPALVLLFRATDSHGEPFSTDVCLFDQHHKLIDRENGRFKDVHAATADEQRKLPAELVFDVEDGAGNWLHLDGPIVLQARDGHGFAMRFVFPRRSPVLKFRASRPGFEPVEFAVPNPGYRSAFPRNPTERLPAVRRCPDFSATLNALIAIPGGGITGQATWADLVAPVDTYQKVISVYDETGNLYGQMPGWTSYAILPNEKVLRINCRLDRYPEEYPFQLTDVTILAEGTMPAGGRIPTALLTPDALSLGYTDVSFEPVAPGTIFLRTGKPTRLIFQLSAAPNGAQVKKLETDYETERAVVFTNGNRVTGYSYNRYTQTGNVGALVNHFSTQHEWAGDLNPGGAFKIALLRKLPPAEVEFFVNKR